MCIRDSTNTGASSGGIEGIGSMMTYNVDYGTGRTMVVPYIWNSAMYFYQSGHNTTWYSTACSELSGATIIITASYVAV